MYWPSSPAIATAIHPVIAICLIVTGATTARVERSVSRRFSLLKRYIKKEKGRKKSVKQSFVVIGARWSSGNPSRIDTDMGTSLQR